MSGTGREVAHRVFAAEYDDATFSYSESDEERAPNYLVTPSGARVNRVFFVGALTQVERVSDEVLRARVADPTGVFVVYAGQYQPDEMAFLEDAEPPMFVAITGKARTFSPDDSDRVFTSVRPESISEVDADTRDRWTVQAAEHTLARVATARAAMALDLAGEDLAAALRAAGAPDAQAEGIPLALDHYGTTEHYLAALADIAVEATEQVAGERDEVAGLAVTPGDAGDGTVDPQAVAAGVEGAVVDIDPDAAARSEVPPAEPEADDGPDTQEAPADEAADAEAPADETTAEEDADSPDVDDEAEPDEAAEEPAGDAEAESEADESGGDREDLGDFEPGGVSADDESGGDEAAAAGDAPDEAPADAEVPEDDVLDDEERERLEEEYGTFESGTEVSEPGEADIEPEAGPIEPEDVDGGGTESGADAEPDEDEPEDEDEPAAEEDAAADEEAADEAEDETTADEAAADEADEDEAPAEDLDLEDAVLSAMEALDDGDGADREELVAAVVDDHGVDPGAVEEAIQDALMAGKCYEPDDAHVKPI